MAINHADLSHYWVDAIGYILAIMTPRQHQLFNFERFYPDVVEITIFGSTEDCLGGTQDYPITIVDDAGNSL